MASAETAPHPRLTGLLGVSPARWRTMIALASGGLLLCGTALVVHGPLPPRRVLPPAPSPVPPAASRSFATLREQGEHLYAANGCFGCHGIEGRDGLTNPNSILGHVPPLDGMAARLALYRVQDVAWVTGRLERDEPLEAPPGRPPFPGHARFLVMIEMFRELIRKGNPSPSLDPNAPAPPLNMPPWAGRLDSRDIDALLVYLLSIDHSAD